MTFKDYLKTMSIKERKAFAEHSGIGYGTIHSIIHNDRKAGMETFNKLHHLDASKYTLKFVRPDLNWLD